MALVVINNGDTGLVVRTALNNMFDELYGPYSLRGVMLTGSSTMTVPDSPSGFVWMAFNFVTAGGGGGGISAIIGTGTSGVPGWTGTLRLKLTSADIVTYVNGAGGAGGPAGANNGSPGGDTTITIGATTYTLKGGLGGGGSASGNTNINTIQTVAAIDAQYLAMRFAVSSDAFWSVFPSLGVGAASGALGIGGIARDNIFGLAGTQVATAAGGNAGTYGNAGGGAGSLTGAGALAGGNGSAGVLYVSW